jgi:hypothetical protein
MKYIFFYILIKSILNNSKIIIPVQYVINSSYDKNDIISIYDSYNTGYLEAPIKVGSNRISIKFKLTLDSFSVIILNSSVSDIPINYNFNKSKTHQMFSFKYRFKNEPIKEGYCASDIFHIKNLNDTEVRYRFFIYPKNIDKIVNEGIKDYSFPGYNLIHQLKENKLINEYTIYFSENETDNLIIGEIPEKSEPNKFIKNQTKNIFYTNFNNSQFKYYLYINCIIFNSIIIDSENFLLFDLSTFFIEGTEKYKNYVKNSFFNNNKCHKGISKLFGDIFYCDKNVDIPKMPSLIFQIKNIDYNITLDYQNLFILLENKLYFIVNFPKNNNIWKIGYYIIKKLNIAFNQDKKTISFSKIKKNEKEKDKNKSSKIFVSFLFLCIFLLVFIFTILFLFCLKLFIKKEYSQDKYIEMQEGLDSEIKANL